MRLLTGYLIVVALALTLQIARPQCSMTDMLGVEWLECLAK